MSRKKPRKKRRLSLWHFLTNPIYALLAVGLVLVLGYLIVRPVENKDLCANSISCINDLSGKYESEENEGVFLGNKVKAPAKLPAQNFAKNIVLGENNAEKRIEVNLSNQHLYAYEGDKLVYDFLISSGKWYPTPTGTFNIWIKLRYTRMSGGDPAWGTYYNLPNVPYVMFFYNSRVPKYRGFGLHGTYWHNNFGHPMSHGCVNMRIEDAEKLYYWTNPPVITNSTYAKDGEGTKIIIYGQTPQE